MNRTTPPTWRSAAKRAGLGAIGFAVLLVLLFNTDPVRAIPLTAILFVICFGVGFYADRLIYRSRPVDRTPSGADHPQAGPPVDLRPAAQHATCLSDPHLQAAFERSNLPSGAWEWGARLLDDYFANVPGVRPRFIEEISVVEFFRKPDGSSMGTDTMLLGVLKVGLILTSDRDFKEFVYSDSAAAAFVADDLMHGRGRGECAIQAVTSGSAPVFRIGWEWNHKSDAHEQFDAAAAERDRILKTMCKGLQLSR